MRLPLLMFIIAVQAHAGLITQASCFIDSDIEGPSSQVSTSSCELIAEGYSPFASASASGAVLLDADSTAIQTSISIATAAYPDLREVYPNFATATATAFAGIMVDVFTSGPVRSGFAEISITGGGGANGGSAGAEGSWRIGEYSNTFYSASSFLICEDESFLCPHGEDPRWIVPFALGVPFSIHLASMAQSGTFSPEIVDDAAASINVRVALMELDGTRVRISTVPEPSTLLLLASALPFLLRKRLGRRGQQW